MKNLKNPKEKNELIWIVLIGILGSILLLIPSFQKSAPLVLLCITLLICVVHIVFAKRRAASLAKLSEDLDRILHGTENILISQSEEGELGVLQSEIHKMTATLKEQSDLLLSDKIRLTDAIADIFHQLRTPLTSMNLIVSMLSKEDLSYEKRIELVRDLSKQLKRIQWLVEALLKISKIDAGTAVFAKENVSVKKLISKASESLLIPMELRSQNLLVNCKDESFIGDFAWTAEAIANLLKNCMEHTPEGGSIQIDVEESALFTQIIVSDSGEGFDEDDIPYLFERFYKGSNATSESIGIGLALSRAIISNQNGTIKAENIQGGGARFVIKFYKSII